MLGTFGGALEARQIDASDGKLSAEVTGEVEEEDGVLVIRRIHVAMRLIALEQTGEKVDRVHAIYAMSCPLWVCSPVSLPKNRIRSRAGLGRVIGHFRPHYPLRTGPALLSPWHT